MVVSDVGVSDVGVVSPPADSVIGKGAIGKGAMRNAMLAYDCFELLPLETRGFFLRQLVLCPG